ncbi:hypothetical protein UB46_13055 [Burkholderiaceae bacterium 16]|nr:hypothetical protein UB46_13055 [Burkholderiaceae bacterium 16]
MDHWQLAYLGMRQIPRVLSEFELATFFTFSLEPAPHVTTLMLRHRAEPEGLVGQHLMVHQGIGAAVMECAQRAHIRLCPHDGAHPMPTSRCKNFLWAYVGAQIGVPPPPAQARR